MQNCEYFFLYFHEFPLQTISFEVDQVVIFFVYLFIGTLVKPKSPTMYNGYFFAPSSLSSRKKTVGLLYLWRTIE